MPKYNGEDLGDVFNEYGNNPGNGSQNNGDWNGTDAERKVHTYGGETKVEHETIGIKCESCGLNMEFDAESGMMKCPACGALKEIDADKSFTTNDFDPELDIKFDWQNETRMFKCANCGAETYFDKTEFATECAFCGSPNVTITEQLEGIRPDVVLPFKLTVERAKEYYTKWIKKRLYAPGAFKKNLDINQFKGVYSPCWLFDANTRSTYKGIAGKYYYVTVGSGDKKRQERRVKWFPVSGTNAGAYKDIIIEASPHMQQKDIDKISPFPTRDFVAYDKRYLLGYTADHYDCGLKQSWVAAKGKIDSDINNNVRREILRRADVIQSLSISTIYSDKKYKYAMLPVFVGRVKYKEKIYNMFTNGITGKCTGKYPKSVPKILATIFGGLLIVGGIILAVVLLL